LQEAVAFVLEITGGRFITGPCPRRDSIMTIKRERNTDPKVNEVAWAQVENERTRRSSALGSAPL
jgi:hypothetical protein